MKKLVYVFLILIGMHSSVAQSIAWTKLFDIHSQNALGGLSKNTVKDRNNLLITAVVESDILKLYQLDAQGNNVVTLNTNRECGFFTPIVKTNDGNYALVYDNTPDEIYPTYKLLIFNANLRITRESALDLPEFDFFTFGSFFTNDDGLYFTGFSGSSHLLFHLNEVHELTLKHISPINGGYRDQVKPIENGALILEYGEGQNHLLRCIATETGALLWDRRFANDNINTFQLNYKTTIGANQNICFAGLERTWVSGQAIDVFKLRLIDNTNGTTLQESTYTLNDTGTSDIDDVRFNPINGHLYISYLSSYPDQQEVLLEFDAQFRLVHQVRLAYTYDNLGAWVKSRILIRDNGNLIFTYTNYKNESENGNLYVVNLTSDLTINGSLELNVAPKNSSESFSHFLMYEDGKMLITGCIPNPDPSIGFEQVQYYLSMIDVDRQLNIDSPTFNQKPLLLSNPVANTLHTNTDIEIESFTFFDLSGKQLSVKPLSQNAFDVSHLSEGMYFISVTDTNGTRFSSKFVKQ